MYKCWIGFREPACIRTYLNVSRLDRETTKANRWIHERDREERETQVEPAEESVRFFFDGKIGEFSRCSISLVSPPFPVFPFPDRSNFVVDTCPDGNRCTSAASYKYIGARLTGRSCIPDGAARVDNRAFESI